MGFLTGVITGIALAAGVAAWYMSRAGERFRDQYHVEQRLGELGDQVEARTRDIQSTVNAQLTEMRAKGDGSTNGHGPAATLDTAAASAAEAASQAAAQAETAVAVEDPAVDAPTVKVRKPRGSAKDTAG